MFLLIPEIKNQNDKEQYSRYWILLGCYECILIANSVKHWNSSETDYASPDFQDEYLPANSSPENVKQTSHVILT